MSRNETILRGSCPPPFFQASSFENSGGYIEGRICASISPTVKCCLPCPATEWLYPESFSTYYTAAEAISVAGVALCVFLLLSFFFLPIENTRRHYVSYGLIIGVLLLSLGFVVPLGQQPEQCFDEVTPKDMYSSLTCAFSGAFIVAGGLVIIVWILIRALSMHLQICWDVMPGKKFFYFSQGLGWGVVAVLFTVTITFTGVSFRFGDVCHVNSLHSMADFWGPLLGMAGLSTLIQAATFAYCIKVYLTYMWSDDKTETQSSAGLPSYTTSLRTRSARAVYRRVRKVVWLQWRGIVVVVFVLVDVIFFAVVFVFLDTTEQRLMEDVEKIVPWVTCLLQNANQREKCFELGQKLFVKMDIVAAILIMLSLVGIQCFLLLTRWAMFTGWYEFIHNKIYGKREFVSLDARRLSADARTFELLEVGQPQNIKQPENVFTFPATLYEQPYVPSGTPDHFGKETQRPYRSPSLSFSTPRAPSQANMHMEWDPRSTHARGGLGLHPPVAEEEQDGMRNKI